MCISEVIVWVQQLLKFFQLDHDKMLKCLPNQIFIFPAFSWTLSVQHLHWITYQTNTLKTFWRLYDCISCWISFISLDYHNFKKIYQYSYIGSGLIAFIQSIQHYWTAGSLPRGSIKWYDHNTRTNVQEIGEQRALRVNTGGLHEISAAFLIYFAHQTAMGNPYVGSKYQRLSYRLTMHMIIK